MRSARSPLAQALREARQTVGMTQEELGRRLGLAGRAIYRWERDEAAPTGPNQRRVVQLIASLDEAAAAKLSAVIASQGTVSAVAAPSALPPAAAAPVAARALVEHGVFAMADELDLPARRVRGALSRWLRRVREGNLALEVVQREIDAWVGDAH